MYFLYRVACVSICCDFFRGVASALAQERAGVKYQAHSVRAGRKQIERKAKSEEAVSKAKFM